MLTATASPLSDEYFSYTSELWSVLSEGVCLSISRVTGMLWCDMTDMHLAHDPNTPSAEEREMKGTPHMLLRAALLEVFTAHEMAQGLWGCCISINKPAQTPVSKLHNGENRASLVLLCNRALAMISLVRLPKANERNHTGCDTEAQGNHHTIKIHCRNQHLHLWAWCTAICIVIFPLSILALLILS